MTMPASTGNENRTRMMSLIANEDAADKGGLMDLARSPISDRPPGELPGSHCSPGNARTISCVSGRRQCTLECGTRGRIRQNSAMSWKSPIKTAIMTRRSLPATNLKTNGHERRIHETCD